MPPAKKPGRPRGSGTGRGGAAGRGRGKATAEPVQGPSSSLQAVQQEDSSLFVPNDNPDSTSVAMDVDPSPNSSPATIPTETPAPTPARPTSTRPDPPISESTTASVPKARGKAGTKDAGTTSKFKPKIVRRTQTEREELARAEMKRKEEVAKETAEKLRKESFRNRGRGGARGRGDAMGRGRQDRKTTAQGIFGIAPEEMAKQGIPTVSTRLGGNFDPDDYVGSGRGGGGRGGFGQGGGSGKNGVQEPQYPLDPDEQKAGKAIDIEKINYIDSSDDDVVITGIRNIKDNDKQKGLKPIRLPRFAHKERAQVLNTDSSTTEVKKEEDDPDSDPNSVVAYPEPGDSNDVQVKEEPTSPSSPRLKRRTQPQSRTIIDLDSPPISPDLSRVKPPTSPTITKKAPKKQPPVFSCEEDKEEYARHLEDVAILARELGGLQSRDKDTDGKGKGPALDANGDLSMSNTQDGPADARAGRLYLFQFPPVLPKLYNPLTTEKPLPEGLVPVKQEDEKKTPASPKLSKAKSKTVDLSGDQPAIKPEPEEEILTASAPDDPNARIPRDRVVAEPGYVGKLIVRESGKVELNWGGASLVVGRGVDASFLTMGVILDRNEKAGPARSGLGGSGTEVEGKALGMGQIMGKFVVKPDWEKMLGDED